MTNSHTTTIRHEPEGQREGTSQPMSLAELRTFVDACEAAGMPLTSKPRFSVRRGERGNTMASVQVTCDVGELHATAEPEEKPEPTFTDVTNPHGTFRHLVSPSKFAEEGHVASAVHDHRDCPPCYVKMQVRADKIEVPTQGEMFPDVTASIGGQLVTPRRRVTDSPQA